MPNEFLTTFKSARLKSTPLIAVATQEPAATMRTLQAVVGDDTPVLQWDISAGLRPRTEAGADALRALLPDGDPALLTNPAEMLDLLARPTLPEDSLVFILNAHRYLEPRPDGASVAISQGIWNLRDVFKSRGSTLLLLGPSFALPAELQQDVLLLDEPLPDTEALQGIIADTLSDSDFPPPPEPTMAVATQAIRGLSPFMAEQVVAMSLQRDGRLDLDALWRRKKTIINQTAGLSVDEGEDLVAAGGLAEIRRFFAALKDGPDCPYVVVRVDEIDDAMGGTQGDNTGVAQYTHGLLLQAMEDNDWPGALMLGAPGTGKTLISRLIGQTLGAITLALDLGATKTSLLGESERQVRTALTMIETLGGKRRVLFVGTCNSMNNLTPQLRRRFQRRGLWHFPLPDAEEKPAIWRVQLARYDLEEPGVEGWPDDTGWSGAEIRNCAELARARRSSLLDAAHYIVPVSQSDPGMIERIEALADGKFLSASKPGAYRRAPVTLTKARPSRKVSFDERI